MDSIKKAMVNDPDKAGSGHQKMIKVVQRAKPGWSFWFLHYEKYGTEGQNQTKFCNLLDGFLRGFDHIRGHLFGKLCVLNEEPDLEI